MKEKHLTLPQKKYEYGYDFAYEIARENLARVADLEAQCQKSGARCLDSRRVAIEYLNQSCTISLPDGEVRPDRGDDLPVREKLLVLHYFLQAKGTPLTRRLVTYKELKEGINYFPVFYQRAIKPLVSFFGSEPAKLLNVSRSWGGQPADYGDAAVTVHAFPYVPLTLALWKGDTEFPPDGNILFDSTVADYLTNDDIHNLCESLAWKMVKRLKAGGDNPG